MMRRRGLDDRVFDTFVTTLLVSLIAVYVFPIMVVISMSFTPLEDILKYGGFSIVPRRIDATAYLRILTTSQIPRGFMVTVALTSVGTALNLLLTSTLAYPLSIATLPGRNRIMFYIAFTMLFSGGLIPTYLVVRSLGLVNTFWAMIVPNAIWASNVILMRIFFQSLPKDIFESARMDGATELLILARIAFPLSLPSFATIGLFYGVSHWNQFLEAVLYISDNDLFPLQLIVRSIIIESEQVESNMEKVVPTMAFRMAAVVTASLPIILVYPFLQRFFIRGLAVGAVKG